MSRGRKGPRYLTHDEDKALVVQALSGSNRAYSILAEKYKPILYTAVRRRLGNSIREEEAEDIVMAVMGRAFVSLHLYDPEKSKLFTWMIACLHNHITGKPKGKRRIGGAFYGGIPTEDISTAYDVSDDDAMLEADRTQAIKLLRMLVDKLPPECAQAIKLKYFREMSYEEIASEMGIKVGDVWYRIKKGRDILRKLSENLDLF